MTIEIFLTEGPNVEGLQEDRAVLYIGYFHEKDGIFWNVIEGIKNDNPRTYKFHTGIKNPLTELKITSFEYNDDETILKFIDENDKSGKIVISNKSPDGFTVGSSESDSFSLFSIFYGGRDRGQYLMGKGLNRKITDRNYYNFKFVGWIVNE